MTTRTRRMFGAMRAALEAAFVTGAAAEYLPPADPALVRRMLIDLGLLRAASSAETADAAAVEALRRFQADNGLVVDGIAGIETMRVLAPAHRDAMALHDLGIDDLAAAGSPIRRAA